MWLLVGLLLCLFASVAFASYQLGEARRWRQATEEAQEHVARQREDLEESKLKAVVHKAEGEKNREVAEAQLKMLTEAQHQLEEKFRALAAEALYGNSQLFLDQSRDQIHHLVDPVNQSLRRFEEQVQAMERARSGAYEGVTAQIQALTQMQERVRQSTEQLKTALRSPIQRGRWGEMQLRRVVELAGMLEYCDFTEQKTLFGETNARPDLIVRLPNQCQVVVDAKVSLEAYLRAIESQEEADRARLFHDHARQVKMHVKSLSEKAYWERLSCSPEFVVAFLPLESLFSAALEQDPELLDYGVSRRVLIATPVTLITLLLTVAHGWRQQALAENIERIRESGLEAYRRLLTMSQHFTKLGDAIERTVGLYNDTVGSLERNVLPSVRRFRELKPANAEEFGDFEEVESSPRRLDPAKWQPLEAGRG
jgi:DNA recombination protein RmuC